MTKNQPPPMILTARYMEIKDLPEVTFIDEASFTPPWPERSYRFELNESQVSFMLVLEKLEEKEVAGFRGLLKQLLGTENTLELRPVIVGYGGLWKIAEEAHISTIASHPNYRGNKYGEILLVNMLKKAIILAAEYIVLEVRVSNHVAQSLYKKYGFEIHGVKRNYYHHDKEDAYDMRLDINDKTIAHVDVLYDKLRFQIAFDDQFSDIPHPRLKR